MPERSQKFEELYWEADEGELPYISKSRIVSWVKNPEHFRLKYLEEIEEPETGAMDRGSRIHETFEHYYLQSLEEPEAATSDPAAHLPDEPRLWADFVEPYISNFFVWERERWEEAKQYATGATVDQQPAVDPIMARDAWQPVAIEDEHWIEEHDPPWSGLADVVLPAASIPDVAGDEGVVIIDFKTGKVPKPQYRDEGIYLELAYYEMLFHDKYDIAGSAAFYPRSGELVVRPDNGEHLLTVEKAVDEMIEATSSYAGEHFETNPGPLCCWSPEPGDRSAFYGICPCTWAVPVDNRDTFEELLSQDLPVETIAERMGTTEDACWYWKRKLDL